MSCFKRSRLILILSSAAYLISSPSFSDADARFGDSNSSALLAQIVSAQQKALDKIKTIEVEIDEEARFNDPSSPEEFKVKQRIMKAGRKIHIVRSSHSGQSKDNEERFVVNDIEAAYWHVGNPTARVWELDPERGLVEGASRAFSSVYPRDPVLYGFGDGTRTLSQMIQMAPSNASKRFQAQELREEGFVGCRVSIFHGSPADGSRAALTMDVSLNTGCLVSRCTLGEKDQKVYSEIKTTGKEVEQGVWFPMHWEYSLFGPKNSSEPNAPRPVLSYSKDDVKSVKLNRQIADSEFNWRTLKMPVGTTVFRETIDGKRAILVVAGDDLVPSERAQSAPKPNRKGLHRLE